MTGKQSAQASHECKKNGAPPMTQNAPIFMLYLAAVVVVFLVCAIFFLLGVPYEAQLY